MTISRIGQLEPIQPGKKPGWNDPVGGNNTSDSITLSPEAKQRAEMHNVMELIKSAPELDEARIVELRQKINDPGYINDTVINITAERIISALGA